MAAGLKLALAASISLMLYFFVTQKNNGHNKKSALVSHRSIKETLIEKSLTNRAKTLITFAKKNNYNESVFILCNMSLSSGKFRIFLYDTKHDSILAKGLVAHGHGKSLSEEVVFSNIAESNCSSKGIYKIGQPYYGTFGLAYKLNGLERSNSNAFARFVVLHAHNCVPNEEQNEGICRSQGCPTVSPQFLQILAKEIDKSAKPMLLDIGKY